MPKVLRVKIAAGILAGMIVGGMVTGGVVHAQVKVKREVVVHTVASPSPVPSPYPSAYTPDACNRMAEFAQQVTSGYSDLVTAGYRLILDDQSGNTADYQQTRQGTLKEKHWLDGRVRAYDASMQGCSPGHPIQQP